MDHFYDFVKTLAKKNLHARVDQNASVELVTAKKILIRTYCSQGVAREPGMVFLLELLKNCLDLQKVDTVDTG